MTSLRAVVASTPASRIPVEAALLLSLYVPLRAGAEDRPVVMWAWVLGAVAVRLVLLPRPRDSWVLAAGIVLGGGSDLLTVTRGVYAYGASDFLPWAMPAWMFVFWGHVFLFTRSVGSLPVFRTRLPADGAFRGGRLLMLDLVTVVVLKTCFYALASSSPARAAIAGAMVIAVRYALVFPTRGELALATVAVVVGPWVEGQLIGTGLYGYRHGVFFGVPIWLVEWWFFAVPFLLRAATFAERCAVARTGAPLGIVLEAQRGR